MRPHLFRLLLFAVLAVCVAQPAQAKEELKVKKWTYVCESDENGPSMRIWAASESREAPGGFIMSRFADDCAKVFFLAVVEVGRKGQPQQAASGAMRVDEKSIHAFQYNVSYAKEKNLAYVSVASVANQTALMDEMRQGNVLRVKVTINGVDTILRIPLAGFAEVAGKQVEACASQPVGQGGKQGAPAAKGDKKDKEDGGGSGTGFFINDQGYLITNYHVVKGAKNLVCEYQTNKYPAKLVKVDAINDLAILKIEAQPKAVLRFREGKPVRTGEEVVAVGFPLYGFVTTHPSVTTGTVNSTVGLGDDSRWLQMTAPIQPGNSGGPLLDMSGNVVGVVVATLDALKLAKVAGTLPQNINFAIRTPLVKSFLEINEVAYSTAPSAEQDLKVVDITDRTLPAVVLVLNLPDKPEK